MSSQGDKLIFAGPVGVGKTTAIGAISDIPPVSTDVAATDETLERKETTTVAMDYGFFTLDDGQYIHLYGTPGQERFDFMWDILTEGGLGLILMVDATRPDPVADMTFYLDRFAKFISATGAVIGLNRNNSGGKDIYEAVQHTLEQRQQPLPVFEIDARSGEDVKLLVHALLATLESRGE
jgi:signal recognition particle receptor subunit beta